MLKKLEFTLSLLGTTSPSYIIMAHLDIARAIMEETGEENIKKSACRDRNAKQCSFKKRCFLKSSPMTI